MVTLAKYKQKKLFILGILLPFCPVMYINGFYDVEQDRYFSSLEEPLHKTLNDVNKSVSSLIMEFPLLINIPGNDTSRIVEANIKLEVSLLEQEEVASKKSQIIDILTLVLTNQEHQLLMDESFRTKVVDEIKETINSILISNSILKVSLDCRYNITEGNNK